MSDFFNNDLNEDTNQNNQSSTGSQSSGEYSYSHNEINQGESYYQWTPYEDKKKKVKKAKAGGGFGKKLGKTAAVALVFGLVAGLAFQSVGFVAEKYFPSQAIPTTTLETATDSSEKAKATITSSSSEATVVTDVSDIVTSVMPAIVQVTNVGLQTYQSMFGIYQQESTSCGSGIIISQDSDNIYIATNNHVVSGAETLTITFSDESAVEGEIKGVDSSCDLAVVSVAVKDINEDTLSTIKVATVGNSDNTIVGEGCVVIGNALGYGQSVTTGVISAKDREVEITDDDGNVITNELIQTDAAVNPGNSGGALLNMNGEVIGIVSAKLSSEQVEGMGYAIPVSYASDIIEQMINKDVVSELEASYLGIGGQDIGSELSSQYNMPTGVYVGQVVEGSGAAKAGIEKGDVIIKFNGRKVTSMSTIQNILKYIPAGTTVEVTVAKGSKDYEEETYQVTLTAKNAIMQ